MLKVPLKTTYGILAALDLAHHYGANPIQAKIIARRQTIPARFVEQILLALKHAGIVESSRGAQGGYSLSRDPAKVSLSEIVQAMNGPQAISHAQGDRSNGHSPTHVHLEVLLSTIWGKVKKAEEEVLTSITLESLVEQYSQLESQDGLMYHI
jgi:Rrf2 family protein